MVVRHHVVRLTQVVVGAIRVLALVVSWLAVLRVHLLLSEVVNLIGLLARLLPLRLLLENQVWWLLWDTSIAAPCNVLVLLSSRVGIVDR